MIRELGNVELFELCETFPKVQCFHCLLYWNQGIENCTCGQFLIDSESRRKFNKLRLDALSIPNYVIKKGRSLVLGMAKPKNKRVPKSLECVEEMLQESWLSRWTFYRYSRSIPQRSSLLWIAIGWTGQQSKWLDELAKEDHTYRLTPQEKRRYQGQWYITLNKSGKKWAYEASIRFSSCCLYEKSSTPRVRRTSWRACFSRTIQYIWHPSSSTSWWNKNWKWAHKNFESD